MWSTWKKISRRIRWTILILALVLVVLRLMLPYAIKSYVNRQLDRVPDYDGHITDVDVQLIRGAYQIHGIKIVKTTGGIEVPFFSAELMDLSLEWKELFHGSLVGEVYLKYATLNFVAGPTEEQSQNGEGRAWNETLASLFPFQLNRFEIEKSQIHFHNFHSTPAIDIFVTELSCVATNLTNSRKVNDQLSAGISAHGNTLGDGRVAFRIYIDPLAKAPTFELDAQLLNVDLTRLNPFLRAYGSFDVERGNFAMFTSIAAKDGLYDGYIKVFFEDLDVFAWKKERQKNILGVFWQAIVGTATTVLKNQPRDQLATKIPISGDFEQTDVATWRSIATLLRNAFIRALVPKLDEKVTVESVEEEIKDAATK